MRMRERKSDLDVDGGWSCDAFGGMLRLLTKF